MKTMNTLVLFDSMGGNTQKVAERIQQVAQSNDIDSTLIRLEEGLVLDFYEYDLVFAGSPVIEWLPTKKMMDFLKKKLKDYRLSGDIPSTAIPLRPGKFAVCFSTNCGAHIGVDEASPMTEWVASFFGHIGYQVLDKIHVPGEMRNFGQGSDWMDEQVFESLNTQGKYGNIKGRPNEKDLAKLETHIKQILDSLTPTSG
jgi:hypothetical protein